jgi:hypothetical protein
VTDTPREMPEDIRQCSVRIGELGAKIAELSAERNALHADVHAWHRANPCILVGPCVSVEYDVGGAEEPRLGMTDWSFAAEQTP